MLYLVSNNARQYYSLLCIVYRYVGIWGTFYAPKREFDRWCGLHKLPSLKRVFYLCNFITLNVLVFLVCFKW